MLSASLRKSVTDLTRRRGRTLFAVATLALAIASISLFAIPTLIDRSMQQEIQRDRLADISLDIPLLRLTSAQLAQLGRVPNVAAVEARNSVDVRVLIGARRAPARIIGVRDFARQRVDVVRLDSGRAPASGELVADVQDANTGRYAGAAGDTLTVLGGGAPGERKVARLPITGVGRNIDGGEQVQDDAVVVFYASAATVSSLSGDAGYQRLALRLDDPTPAAAAATLRAFRDELRNIPGFSEFRDLPGVRAPGEWPGKDETDKFAELLSVITLLALLSALVLTSSTMTTLVAEQTREVGIMRSLGARRRDVKRIYLRTAALLGALGAIVGMGLGIVLSNLAAAYFGQEFWAIDVGFGVDVGLLAVSGLIGVVGPPLAALPAIRRAVRVDLREALESTGSVIGPEAALDRGVRRLSFLPRTMQLGLRNVGRRKRRSFATTLIVALAVANLLAIMGLATAITDTTRSEWDDHLEDVTVWTAGQRPFDKRAERVILSTPGVASAQPALSNDVTLGNHAAVIWGLPQQPLFRYRLDSGRWFTADEARSRRQVAVIESNLARATGTEVGDPVSISTAAGPANFLIVGIAKNQQENGTVLFAPLTTVRWFLGQPSGASAYRIETTSPDHALVDRTTARLEDRLGGLGYEVGNEITYVATRDNVKENSSVTTSIAVLGFLVVAISMVGLANAITTSVLERVREIGVLRCIGARARDVRRIFASEGVALATAGWLAGIPLGYALDRVLVWLVEEVANIDVPVAFPLVHIPLALVGTVLLALLIIRLPIRRAVRFRAGDALRYG